ncbi:GDSL-type esterase/lipase family protein [Verrucomicrobiota bacterium sgz303538]
MLRCPVLVAVVVAFSFVAGIVAQPRLHSITRRPITPPATRPTNEPYDPALYSRRVSIFEGLQSVPDVVLLGDSRINEGEWSEVLKLGVVGNRGVSGDTTTGVLGRLNQSVPMPPKVCIIQLGVNDVARGTPTEEIAGNFRRILTYFRRERTHLLVTSVILTGGTQTHLNPGITRLNKELQSLVANEGAEWVDVNAAMCPNGFLPDEITTDGVHLSGKGYRLFSEQIQKVVSASL